MYLPPSDGLGVREETTICVASSITSLSTVSPDCLPVQTFFLPALPHCETYWMAPPVSLVIPGAMATSSSVYSSVVSAPSVTVMESPSSILVEARSATATASPSRVTEQRSPPSSESVLPPTERSFPAFTPK